MINSLDNTHGIYSVNVQPLSNDLLWIIHVYTESLQIPSHRMSHRLALMAPWHPLWEQTSSNRYNPVDSSTCCIIQPVHTLY
jgi:hypothetical protein